MWVQIFVQVHVQSWLIFWPDVLSSGRNGCPDEAAFWIINAETTEQKAESLASKEK
jgi:hypothetical protein